MNKLFTLFWTLGLFLLFTKASVGQMTVTNGETAEDLAAVLTGEGVNVYNAELTGCELNQRGTFKFPAGTSDLGIDSGIVLTTGAVIATGTGYGQAGVNDPYSSFASHDNGNPGDPDLTVLAGVPTNDACILEFDFVPSGD